MKLPRDGSKKFEVLKFIGRHDGVRFGDIQRFICELNGLDYDLKVPTSIWNYRTKKLEKVVRRRWAGIWSTNLCYGKDAILRVFCVKGGDRKWRLSSATAQALKHYYNTQGLGITVYDETTDPFFIHNAPSGIPSFTRDTNPGSHGAAFEWKPREIKNAISGETYVLYERVEPEPVMSLEQRVAKLTERLVRARDQVERNRKNVQEATKLYEEAQVTLNEVKDQLRDALWL